MRGSVLCERARRLGAAMREKERIEQGERERSTGKTNNQPPRRAHFIATSRRRSQRLPPARGPASRRRGRRFVAHYEPIQGVCLSSSRRCRSFSFSVVGDDDLQSSTITQPSETNQSRAQDHRQLTRSCAHAVKPFTLGRRMCSRPAANGRDRLLLTFSLALLPRDRKSVV